ncbi:hypothetical protein LEP1GSC050_2296 [Leptospira broomii serovar Hurstbridge str. 5399]|uniref:Uncharacterized protein n=1 Tax=Leptospira broomii serovar Hurstbridge str. 5399 TaxID=1049789 RepID=T0FAK1_9LEPT|nr:hypothetical protein [Leptospira broomii]EQA44567.1 hypothetical protein LEP1GSC050_2296 [Leptospira broomii serovar Hurstbridge str. 5399]
MERVKDSRFLFDLKRRFRYILEEVEKSTFDRNTEVRELETLWEEMFDVASRNDTPYFRARLANLKRQLDGFVKNKAYEKREFDIIYRQLEKIRKDDTVEFLDDSMRTKLDRITKSTGSLTTQVTPPLGIEGMTFSGIPLFLTFRCGTINFIIKSGPKKIFRNVDRSKDRVLYEGRKYPVFPSRTIYFTWEGERHWETEPGNLLMIRNARGIRFFRYDTLGDTFRIPEDTFRRRLKVVEGWTGEITRYFRKAGTRYYYIPEED